MSGADDRFRSMHTAPTFKSSKHDKKKVKVDERFKGLLSDERFQSVGGNVDRYGRKANGKGAEKVADEMKQFYEIDDGGEEEPKQEQERPKRKGPSSSSSSGGGAPLSADARLEYLTKLARGELSDGSSSDADADSDSASSSSESDDSDNEGAAAGEAAGAGRGRGQLGALSIPDQQAPLMAEGGADGLVDSTRIAVQNCDWDSLSAEDIMVMLQSFCPAGGAVRKVTIYASDLGQRCMERESRYGPRGIWQAHREMNAEDAEEDDEEEEEEGGEEEEDEEEEGEEGDEEEEGEDDEFYENILPARAAEGEEEDKEEGEEEEGGSSGSKGKGNGEAKGKGGAKGDFRRRGNAVGLVLQTDLELRGKADPAPDAEGKSSSGGGSGGAPEGSGFDEVALRRYELRKLRYYFAVADCDSARTANLLYEELDGVEVESSSMVLDLSLVPAEVDLEGRPTKDTHSASASGATNPNYQPPAFVVDALQHTKVKCSWDDDEVQRQRALSKFSDWRTLNESELRQYVASSSEGEDEGDEEEESESDSGSEGGEAEGAKQQRKPQKKGAQKKARASLYRSMLMGGGEDDEESCEEGGHDDFFADADEGEDGFGAESGDEEEDGEGEGGLSLTYMPEASAEAAGAGADETPYEQEQRKMAERKKIRKAAKKAAGEKAEADKRELIKTAAKAKGKSKGKSKGKGGRGEDTGAGVGEIDEDEARRRADLQLLFSDGGEGGAQTVGGEDYDMREAALRAKKQQKQELKKSKKGKKGKASTEGGADAEAGAEDGFRVDTADPRFGRLFEGDARFGIDTTSAEFRATPAARQILQEQARRRQAGPEGEDGGDDTRKRKAEGGVGGGAESSLVKKLKSKFGKKK